MLIKDAKIVIKENETRLVDVLIEDGKIKEILNAGSSLAKNYAKEVIDAKQNLLLPGGIDVHVHLREPGYEHKETIKTGTKAAARGGYTSICAMPNLRPFPDNVEDIKTYLEIIKKDALVNVYPHACISISSLGKELVDMKAIKDLGIDYFSDDGVGVQDDEFMSMAMKKAKENSVMIVAHTEDMKYRKPGSSVHEGENAKKRNYIGIPSETEYKQIERDLEFALVHGTKYHICHMSAYQSVDLLREYKKKGADVSGEVGIHHLLLTEDDVINTNYKMNPPLRTKEDQKALIEGLKDGTIDFLANDHAPHTKEDKEKEMSKAAFGIVTIESAIPLFYTNFVKTAQFNLEEFVDIISRKPALRYGLDKKGKIEVGYDADLIILEEKEYKIDKEKFYSKGRNTPFDGYTCSVDVVCTIVNGKKVYSLK